MDFPADQKLLFDDLTTRLAAVGNEAALVRFMADVLKSLLRRKGDADFLAAVQDAFTEGIAGRPWEEQRRLAADVIRVVIEKRPEIARAWQALYGPRDAPPPEVQLRRATDPVPQDAPRPEPVIAPPPAEPEPEEEPYEFGSSEAMVADYLAGVLARRLELFRPPLPGFPTVTYCHAKPFFLFSRPFAEVTRQFMTGPLLAACRVGLERRVYRHAKPEVLRDHDARKAFLTEKRPEVWKIFVEKLTKLAAAQKVAEAKMAAAAAGVPSTEPEYKVVEIPVTRPRVHRILGVEFTLGSETVTRRARVKTKSSHELEPQEIEAIELIGQFRHMAARDGVELPPAADFQFLRNLLDFDAKRFAQTIKEYSALAGHRETTRKYLFERLAHVDKTYNNYLSDILIMLLFYEHGDGRFGFRELYDVCVGTALEKTAVASKRPFVTWEVGRRPRELAFQIRETLRRRLELDAVLAAVQMLLDAWEVMGKKRFRHELDAALTVLGAFPLAFTGDPDEIAFTDIGHVVQDTLAAPELDKNACTMKVAELYERARRRHAPLAP